MHILMVLTSHDQLGDTGKKTGFWLEEFAAPYYVFKDAGAEVTLASPKGGQPPLDPTSDAEDAQTEATRRFKSDSAAQEALSRTALLSTISADDYDAVFFPGGHGPMWDLAEDAHSAALIAAFAAKDRPIGAVCHAPAMFKNTKTPEGEPFVAGRKVTGFTNSEEEGAGLTQIVPFLLENMLTDHGALYSKGEDWSPYVVTDGKLVTGQNPASSEEAARRVLSLL
jgi:putative intracellular protease/amidase